VVVLPIKPRRLNLLQMTTQTPDHQIQKSIRRRIRSTKRLNQRKRKMKKRVKRKKRRERERKKSKLRRRVMVLRGMNLKKNEVDIFKSSLFLGNNNFF
jgi:hypothetical protein